MSQQIIQQSSFAYRQISREIVRPLTAPKEPGQDGDRDSFCRNLLIFNECWRCLIIAVEVNALRSPLSITRDSPWVLVLEFHLHLHDEH
jgi:hypothetical protein